jgi:uncharacterized membrane protein
MQACIECESSDHTQCCKECHCYDNTLIFNNSLLATLIFGIMISWFLFVTKLIVFPMAFLVLSVTVATPISFILDFINISEESRNKLFRSLFFGISISVICITMIVLDMNIYDIYEAWQNAL